jgi:hypothetical protein
VVPLADDAVRAPNVTGAADDAARPPTGPEPRDGVIDHAIDAAGEVIQNLPAGGEDEKRDRQ